MTGDFQQLQPVQGLPQLHTDLKHVNLLQHPVFRCSEPILLELLNHIRVHQPSRREIAEFFGTRRLPDSVQKAVTATMDIEGERQKMMVVLTATNNGAAAFNRQRIAIQFPDA